MGAGELSGKFDEMMEGNLRLTSIPSILLVVSFKRINSGGVGRLVRVQAELFTLFAEGIFRHPKLSKLDNKNICAFCACCLHGHEKGRFIAGFLMKMYECYLCYNLEDIGEK